MSTLEMSEKERMLSTLSSEDWNWGETLYNNGHKTDKTLEALLTSIQANNLPRIRFVLDLCYTSHSSYILAVQEAVRIQSTEILDLLFQKSDDLFEIHETEKLLHIFEIAKKGSPKIWGSLVKQLRALRNPAIKEEDLAFIINAKNTNPLIKKVAGFHLANDTTLVETVSVTNAIKITTVFNFISAQQIITQENQSSRKQNTEVKNFSEINGIKHYHDILLELGGKASMPDQIQKERKTPLSKIVRKSGGLKNG